MTNDTLVDLLRLPAGYSLRAYERLGSTNDEARNLAESGAEDGTLVWARQQIRGRGRQGRGWQSLPGNLFCSWVLRPPCAPEVAAQLGFVAALAVGDTAAALVPTDRTIRNKWPNDVLIDGKKMSGILLESRVTGEGRLDWVVLGIGLNVANAPDLEEYATISLRAAGAPELSLELVLQTLAEYIAAWRARWTKEGFAPLRATWLERAAALGEEVELRLPRESLRGTFRDLDEQGALVLELPDRSLRSVSAGEVNLIA